MFFITYIINYFSPNFNLLIKKSSLIVSLSVIMLFLFSLVYVQYFENIDYQYNYVSGYQRVISFLDFSNYIRFKSNLLVFDSLNGLNLFIGYEPGTFFALELFSDKTIFPHSTFFALFVRFGFIATLLYYNYFIVVLKKTKSISFLLSNLVFSLFLGPSFFYGIDLIILFILTSKKAVFENV